MKKSITHILGGTLAVVALLFAVADFAAAQTWTQLSPVGGPPAVRILHSAVFNPTNNRMIVFGGQNGPGVVGVDPLLNDVWVLANADGLGGPSTWTQLSPTGAPPSARAYHSAVYDAVNNRMMVFAGDPQVGFCFGAVNDSWVLTNADGTGGTPNWTQLSPTGGPAPGRQGPTAVYDSATNRMVVFGGRNNACVAPNNEVWVLQNANGLGGTPTWTQLFPTGGPPLARGGQAVYDGANNRMILFSECSACPLGDLWVLQNANGLGGTPTWTQLFPTGGPPPFRLFHTAVYNQEENRMTVFGGCCNATGGRFNDVWVLEHANGLGGTPNWTQSFPTGGPPSGRGSHTAVFNPATNRMVAFAGQSCSVCGDVTSFTALNDVWVLANAVGRAATATAVTSSANPSVFGQPATFTATVTPSTGPGTPTGTVAFNDGATTIATGTLGGGQAAFTTSSLSVGSHSITAVYNGDSSFSGSTSAPLTQTVNKASTQTAVSSSANPSILSQSVTSTANVSVVSPGAGTPTGTVTFQDGTTVLGTVTLSPSGSAMFTTSLLSVGSHSITVAYSGDGNFNGSSGGITQQVAYGICALYDQTKSVKSGAAFPIKLYLCGVSGNDVSSSSIVLHATQVVNLSGAVGAPASPGNANPDSDFRFDSTLGPAGGYIFNLGTSGLAPGTYSLQFTATGDPVTHSVNFGVS